MVMDNLPILPEFEGYPLPSFSPWSYQLPLDSLSEQWSEGYKDALSTIRIRLNGLKEKHNVKG